jgi:hypothetical protein
MRAWEFTELLICMEGGFTALWRTRLNFAAYARPRGPNWTVDHINVADGPPALAFRSDNFRDLRYRSGGWQLLE